MAPEIRESDWKLLRDLKPVALERFCDRVLTELAALSTADGKGAHERYLAVFDQLTRRDRDLSRAFDGLRRSTALLQLAVMRSHGLFTDEEFARFSPETRRAVDTLRGG